MQFTNIKVLFGITRKVVFLGYVAAQWWSKNWMSASLWPGKSVVPVWVSWLECNTRNHWKPLLFARCTAASQVLRQFGKSLQMTAVTFINACCNQSVCTNQSNLSATGLFQTEDLTQFVVYWFCCKIVAKYLCNFAVKLLSWNNYHTVYGGIFPFLFRSTRFWLISECKPLKVWGCLPAVHL